MGGGGIGETTVISTRATTKIKIKRNYIVCVCVCARARERACVSARCSCVGILSVSVFGLNLMSCTSLIC